MGLIVGVLSTIAIATTGAISTVYADNDNNPSDENHQANIDKHEERAFDKDNNDHGQQTALGNLIEDNDCKPPLCIDDGGTGGGP